MHTRSRLETRYLLEQLGVNWYLNFDSDMSQTPSGANKVPFLQVPTDPAVWTSGDAAAIEGLTDQERDTLGFFTSVELSQMAQNAPGSYWYVFGGANRYGFMTGTRFAPVFHYYSTQIKQADPTANIIGTSILNWDYTCIGCEGLITCEDVLRSGYQCGETWLKEFIGAYESTYGEKPPSVKGGEKVYQCGGGIVYHRHDEKRLNWEPGGVRSGAGVRRSGVSQESSGSSETWEATPPCRLWRRR